MKEIKIPYSEYLELTEKISKQEEVIKRFQDADNVVILDNRSYFNELTKSVCSAPFPDIKANNESLAKEYMAYEFNRLFESHYNLEIAYFRLVELMSRRVNDNAIKKIVRFLKNIWL
jgi:hypothetical protein